METIIYTLPKTEKIIESTEINIFFDNQPSPKLMKYGFNNINEQLDMVALTAVTYYRVGLSFDFGSKDENSIVAKASTTLGTKNFDQHFAEFWEILNIFGLLNENQNIYTTHIDTIKNITDTYDKLTNTKHKFLISGGKIGKSTQASLVINKYSDIDIDENAAIQLIINQLTDLLNIQEKGANMIIQLFSLQTQTSAEIIYYLTTLYREAYLMKPSATSDLSDSKYLILLGLKTIPVLLIPEHPDNVYLISLGLGSLPDNFVSVIQCMNADIIPKKYKAYGQIKSFLDTKVYEGATYQEMLKVQHENAVNWLEKFTYPSKMKTILDEAVKKSTTKCDIHTQLIKLLNQ
jgi:hypothetical protein